MKPKYRNLLLSLGTALIATTSAHADTIYWDGPSASWNLNTNWTTDPAAITPNPVAAPGALDDAIFNRTGQNSNITVTLDADQAAQSLTFNSTGTTTFRANAAADLTARTLSIGTGGITVASTAGNVTFGNNAGSNGNVNLTLTGNQTWTNNKAASSVTAEVLSLGVTTGNLNYGANTWTIDGTGVTGFASGATITGSGNLIKNGTGTFVFNSGTADNVTAGFTGKINLNGGVARFQNTNSLGSGNIEINGGILEGRFGGTLTRAQGTIGDQIQITGGVSGFSGQGSSGTTFDIGAITWGSATFNPTEFVLQSATTNTNGASSLLSSIDLNGATRTIRSDQVGTGTGTFAGVISNSTGTAGLIKKGVGTLNLSVANTYNGGTTVSEGTLSASTSASRLGSNVVGNDISVSAGARLLLNNVANVGNNQTITLNNTGSSLSVLGLQFNALPTAAVTFGSDTGVLALNTTYNTNLTGTLSGKSIFLGSTGSGTFSGGAATIAAGTGNVYRLGGGGGTLTISGTNALTGSNSVVVGSTATNGSGTVIFSAAQDYSGGLTLNAGSTISGIGSGTYGGFGSGAVTINGGTLLFNSGANATISNNMNWDANFIVSRGPSSAPTVNWDGNITLGANVTVGGSAAGAAYTQVFNGNIGQDIGGRALAFTTAGTGGRDYITLNGNNTFTGNLSIDKGSLTIGGSGKLGGGDYSGNISITGTTDANFIYSSSSDQILRGAISLGSARGLTKDTSSTSTLTLTNTSTYTGATEVNAGKLTIAFTGNINTTSGVSIGAGEFNYNSSTALTKAVTFSGTGGTLSGSGTINQAVNVTTGNTLAVGNSPGQMNFANTLDLAGTTIMEIDGNAGAGVTGGHDFVNLTGVGAAGVLTYGGLMTLDIGTIFGVGGYSWNLFDMASETSTFSAISLADQYSGSLLDADLDGIWDLTSGDNTWQFTESTGVLSLNVAAIPEPNAAALLGALGTLLLLRRRR